MLETIRNWLRPRSGTGNPKTGCPARLGTLRQIRNHIDLPSSREPDQDVLEQLRVVDPVVDLHYMGVGVWALGSVQLHSERTKLAIELIASERTRPTELQSMGRYRMARLQREGFRLIDFYDDGDVESRKIVREFRFADWRYRHCAEEAFSENLRGSDMDTDLTRRVAMLLDFQQSEGRDIWRYAFGGRRGIRQPGSNFSRRLA